MNNKIKKYLAISGIVIGVLIFGILTLIMGIQKYAEHARKAWKEKAIPEIAQRAGDREWITNEIALLRSQEEPGENGRVIAQGWLTDDMILMGTGEWLIYKSHCNKFPPHEVKDIFLAIGSDGKWYYSTCHFCVGMVALLMMQREQPPDLAFFAKRYYLYEFDGKSDECLKETKTFPDEL